MAKSHMLALVILSQLIQLVVTSHLLAKGIEGPQVKLMNATVASDYVVTTVPVGKFSCPYLGFLRFLPGGGLTGVLVTDMAKSKAQRFTGKYSISDGKLVKFTSDDPNVPLEYMSGTLAFSVTTDPRRPPVDDLTLTTDRPECPQQIYKFALFEQED